MPELPEVEVVRRRIAPFVTGRTIRSIHYYSPLAAAGKPAACVKSLTGRRIVDASRQGKYLIFPLDRGWMTIHLRMTGRLLIDGKHTAWTRAEIELDDGHTLVFEDPRQFGFVVYSAKEPAGESNLGPDALGIALDVFRARVSGRRGTIKPLLMNQKIISGLGNIYVDEALHRAGIHPLTSLQRIGITRLTRLHAAIAEVLKEALAAGGSSISDFVNADGWKGEFQISHRVYGREDEACVACGTLVRRIVVGQRGTHFCPRCQRK
jgi:formamidopyrimidine-DNA glycosylase